MYQKIDPKSEVKTLPNKSLISLYVVPLSGTLKFNIEEMKELLASMTQVYLNENVIGLDEYTNKETFLMMSLGDKILTRSVREYVLQMLNQLHPIQNDILEELVSKNYDRKSLLENEQIRNFCYENIIYDLSYTRVVDFGNFLLEKITEHSFKNIIASKEKQFFDLKIRASKLTKRVLKGLADMNIYDGQAKLAIKLFHYKYHPHYDELRSFEFGQNVLQENLNFNVYCENIKEIIEHSFNIIIEKGRNNNLENNRGW